MKTNNITKIPQFNNYYRYINLCSVSKSYSGVAIYTKQKANKIITEFPNCPYRFNQEGRFICLYFDTYIIINVYVVNSKINLTRLNERLQWENYIQEFLSNISNDGLPIILCGDLNVVPTNKDINMRVSSLFPGTSFEERQAFNNYTLIDTYRHVYPNNNTTPYTFWMPYNQMRVKNIGCRLDMFMISDTLLHKINNIVHLCDYLGSDHCPILLSFNEYF